MAATISERHPFPHFIGHDACPRVAASSGEGYYRGRMGRWFGSRQFHHFRPSAHPQPVKSHYFLATCASRV